MKKYLYEEWKHFVKVNSSDRPFELPLFAALSLGMPLLLGIYWGHLEYGLTASLGGLIFLYIPNTQIEHRMVYSMACAFGMIFCYAMGLIFHLYPISTAITMSGMAVLVTMICRYYALGPPGSLFFIMAVAIGTFTPLEFERIPHQVGLIAMGCMLAWLLGLIYSLHILRRRPPLPPSVPKMSFDFVIYDSLIIGIFVGISIAIAQFLELDRPYWVPVSCLAVIQGVTFRAAWMRQVHRIIGTCLGLLLTWTLLALHLESVQLCLVMMSLIFTIECLIVRHYGLAVIFITPFTIFLAELGSMGGQEPGLMIRARLVDTALGCVVGILGAVLIHNARLRTRVRKIFPYF